MSFTSESPAININSQEVVEPIHVDDILSSFQTEDTSLVIENRLAFKDKLAGWSIRNNVTQAATTELLQI
jgi:hypothetical protein